MGGSVLVHCAVVGPRLATFWGCWPAWSWGVHSSPRTSLPAPCRCVGEPAARVLAGSAERAASLGVRRVERGQPRFRRAERAARLGVRRAERRSTLPPLRRASRSAPTATRPPPASVSASPTRRRPRRPPRRARPSASPRPSARRRVTSATPPSTRWRRPPGGAQGDAGRRPRRDRRRPGRRPRPARRATARPVDRGPRPRARRPRGPGPLLVLADFDGTLAPIARDRSRPHRPARASRARRLARVAERPELVAPVILSGPARPATSRDASVSAAAVPRRSRDRARQAAAARPRAERLAIDVPPSCLDAIPHAKACGDAVAAVAGRGLAARRAEGPVGRVPLPAGAGRGAAPRRCSAAVAAAESAGVGAIQLEGRMVVELRPVGAGARARRPSCSWSSGPAAAIASGDDRTDAEAFAAPARASGLAASSGARDGRGCRPRVPHAVRERVRRARRLAARRGAGLARRVPAALSVARSRPARPGDQAAPTAFAASWTTSG